MENGKIKVTTNQGKIFDFFLNLYLNLRLKQEKPETMNAVVNITNQSLSEIKGIYENYNTRRTQSTSRED